MEEAGGSKHQLLWEEVPFLKVEKTGKPVDIYKRSRIRGAWEGKGEAGRKSITKERYSLIEGKLRNYLVPFPRAKTDVKSISIR